MNVQFEGSIEELSGLFSLIRSEPITPEQLAALTAGMKTQDARAQAAKDSTTVT